MGISQCFPVKIREIVDIGEDGDSFSSRAGSGTGFSGSFWAELACCSDSAVELFSSSFSSLIYIFKHCFLELRHFEIF